jgi:site-specific recombinase XerC
LAITTINLLLNALRSSYSWAVKQNKLQHNPMDDIQDIKSIDKDSEKIMWLSEEGRIRRFIESCQKDTGKGVDHEEKYRRDRTIIYLLTYAGLRVDEISKIKLTDLDLELRRIRIIGKGRKLRTVPMSNTLCQELPYTGRFLFRVSSIIYILFSL